MAQYWGTAAEVLEPVFNVIQGGRSVEAAQVTELIADNGAKIFDITTSEAFAANGNAANIAEVVDIASGAASGTTSGAGILTTEIGVAGPAIATALGVSIGWIAGNGLYNLSPDFWANVSDSLVNAGQTVKGKLIGLLDSQGNTTYSKETIEIIKNALIDANVFNPSIMFDDFVSIPAGGNHPLYTYHENNVTYSLEQNVAGPVNLFFYGGNTFYLCGVGTNAEDITFRNNPPYGGSSLNPQSFEYDGTTYYYFVSNRCTGGKENFDFHIPFIEGTQTPSEFILELFNNSEQFRTFASGSPYTQEGATTPTSDPFEETYPTWVPHTFPIEIPNQYPVSMPLPDLTQDPAQSGENSLNEQLNKIIEGIFENVPVIDPQVAADPEAATQLEQDTTTPEPAENPIDPNKPVPTTTIPVVLPTLDSISVNRMFTVYNPTDAEVNSLGAFLWTTNVIEQIKQLWEDPMQAIISFHKIYGVPVTGSSKNIVLGYIDSGVNAAEVTEQFCEIDCGSITIPERVHNATDYSPFTSLQIYLPFIGFVELDTNELMNATIHVKYRIDVYTGTCIALLYAQRSIDLPVEQLLYTFSGNASQQLPLTAASFSGAISSLLGLAGAGVSVATGGAMGIAAGAISAAHSLTQEMVHLKHSGGLSGNAGIMAPRKPFVVLSRQYGYDASGYAGFYGLPANKTVYLGNCAGYVKCKEVLFNGSCTDTEREEVEALLKEGVWL